jgi:hypothetical protein
MVREEAAAEDCLAVRHRILRMAYPDAGYR